MGIDGNGGRRAGVALLAAAAVLGGCGEQPAAPPPAATTPPPAAAAAGIDWFKGDVESAFATARASRKPVLLYWGAEWCPDCKQLKSSVFAREDFIARTRQFVPVYLDGDQPGAQAWGDTFRVTGYPTVVVLDAERREITRLAGGMDLTLYAATLDAALADLRPMADVVAAAAADSASVSPDDCRRLAWHAFGLEDGDVFPESRLAAALGNAAASCKADPGLALRLRLLAATRGLASLPDRYGADGPAAPDGAQSAALRELAATLADPAAAAGSIDVLNALPASVFAAARTADEELGRTLATRIETTAALAAQDARFPPADQLYAERLRLAALAATAPDGKVPAAAGRAAIDRAKALLASNPPGYVHASLVSPTLFIYTELGDWESQRALLTAEAAASRNAHYYLGNLARVEEQLGNRKAALARFAEAWQRSAGTATRAQWGYDYVGSLLRLSPDDTATIESTGLAVLDDLGTRENVHRRTQARLARLGTQLGEWATTPPRKEVLRRLHARLQVLCAAGGGPADSDCGALFPAG